MIADAYDKGIALEGVGHHTASYAEGYRNGQGDTTAAYREPMNERDQALYAAYLLLTEARTGRFDTRNPWGKAVDRWRDEYVKVFGGGA